MDLENQARVKDAAQKYGSDNVMVILGAAEAEAAGLAAETVTNGDPSYAGPLAGVQLGLQVYHVMEPALREALNPDAYQQHLAMMEMVLDVEAITREMERIREAFGKG